MRAAPIADFIVLSYPLTGILALFGRRAMSDLSP
jgi:hypothetical protein